MFPKQLPPFLLRRGCGGQVGLVIHNACAADGTFLGPRSLKRPCPTLCIVLVSEDHARHCVSCSSQKTMPDTVCRARLKRPCPTPRVVLVSKDHARHCVSCSSQKTMPDTACRARLKRPCPTLRVVLVSKDHARHCVSCSSQKTMPDTVCRARLRCSVQLRRTHTFERGIVNIPMVFAYHLLSRMPYNISRNC